MCTKVLDRLIWRGPLPMWEILLSRRWTPVRVLIVTFMSLETCISCTISAFVSCHHFLFSCLDDLLMLTVNKNRSKLPKAYSHSWQELFETKKVWMRKMINRTKNTSHNYKTTKQDVHKVSVSPSNLTILIFGLPLSKALHWDNYQCLLTGSYDFKLIPMVPGQIVVTGNKLSSLQCMHIFPQSINLISGHNMTLLYI